MEAQPSPRPILLHGRRNPKYGRYDFERFDHLSSSPANVGYGTFHKVNINCRFLFKKSRWGVLGENKNPAGIIYLDLTFDQPKDCQLHSATVIVTLDDKEKGLQTIGGSLRGTDCPVHLTECYGPKGFAGPEKIALSKKSIHFTPNAQLAGFGIGGLGIDKESSLKYSSRWNFSGNLQGSNSTDWAYKTLKWELSENDLETQSTHSNLVHTAFTFAHGGQPFLMRVEIKGKLKKLHTRVRDKLMKFPSSAKKEEGSIVTLINFGNRMRFETPLDERAQELAFEMEMANLQAIPMEVSDPRPVNFLDVPQNSRSSNGPSIEAPSNSWSQPQNSIPGSFPQQLPASTQSQPLQNAQSSVTTERNADPMLADLAQAFVDLQAPDGHNSYWQDRPNSSSKTFTSGEPEASRNDGLSVSIENPEPEISQEQMFLRLLEMPGFLFFLRMVAGLLGLFSRASLLPAEDQVAAQKKPNRGMKKLQRAASESLPKRNALLLEQEDVGVNDLQQSLRSEMLKDRREQVTVR